MSTSGARRYRERFATVESTYENQTQIVHLTPEPRDVEHIILISSRLYKFQLDVARSRRANIPRL